jgi:2'-5' RNA ligase
MRAFIAIDLPLELKEKISRVISELRAADFCDAKWVSEQQLHITPKFLGDIRQEDLRKIKTVLEGISQATKSFPLQLKGIGHFNQRVLWIGGNSGQREAIELAGKIDERLSVLGFEKEARPFAVHLTLARIRYIKHKIKFQQILEKYETKDFGSFKVDKIKLIESVLSTEGPTYKTIGEFNLI